MFHIQNGIHQHRAVLNCGEIMIDSATDETISKQEGMKMRKRILRDDHIAGFREYLSVNEKSTVTISKYTRDAARFMEFAASRPVDKTLVLEYKNSLINGQYAVTSINSMLASLNSFLKFLGWEELKVRSLRVQHQIFCPEEKELTKEEYFRLLDAARNRPWLHLLIQTIGGTGIRVSEVTYFIKCSLTDP